MILYCMNSLRKITFNIKFEEHHIICTAFRFVDTRGLVGRAYHKNLIIFCYKNVPLYLIRRISKAKIRINLITISN